MCSSMAAQSHLLAVTLGQIKKELPRAATLTVEVQESRIKIGGEWRDFDRKRQSEDSSSLKDMPLAHHKQQQQRMADDCQFEAGKAIDFD